MNLGKKLISSDSHMGKANVIITHNWALSRHNSIVFQVKTCDIFVGINKG